MKVNVIHEFGAVVHATNVELTEIIQDQKEYGSALHELNTVGRYWFISGGGAQEELVLLMRSN